MFSEIHGKKEEIEIHRAEAEEEAERVKAELVNGSLFKQVPCTPTFLMAP